MQLSVGEDGVWTNVFRGSLLDRLRASKRTFWRRLAIWTAASAATLVALKLTVPAPGFVPNSALLALDIAFCCCAALGAFVYNFATFTISRNLRDVLASAGFCALAGGAAMQAAADFGGFGPTADDRIMAVGLAYASVAFCGAAFAGTSWRPATRAGSWTQLACAGLAAAAFPLVALPRAIESIAYGGFDSSDLAASTAYATGGLWAAAALGLLIAAILGNYRRYRHGDERMPGIECYFYIDFAFAVLARALSTSRFDAWWICSQVLFVESWLVFLTAVAIENAVAHKEGNDRLVEMEALHDVSWSLVGAKNVSELTSLLAHTVREKLDAKIAAVYLADGSRENLELVAISGPDILLKSLGATYKAVSTDRQPGFHSGHTARALATGETQVAEDVFVDVEFVPWRMIARDNGCAVSLPLVDKGRATGVLNLYFIDRGQLTQQRLELLKTIVAAATPAIENARASEAPRAGLRDIDLAA